MLLYTLRLDKMLVDNVGDVTITNDGATILSLLEVSHPAVCQRLLNPPHFLPTHFPTPHILYRPGY